MLRLLFLASCSLCATFLFAGLLEVYYRKTMQMKRRINVLVSQPAEAAAASNEGMADEPQDDKPKSFRTRILDPLLHAMRQKMADKMSKQAVIALQRRLNDAGNPFQFTPADFRVLQLSLFSFFFLLPFLLFVKQTDDIRHLLLMSLLSGVFGLIYPNYYLKAKKKQRIIAIQKAMPDFFDMVNVSIEAGLGLDAALLKVCKQSDGPLSIEFLRTLDAMKLGKSRREAFAELRDRVPCDPLQSVMNAMIQADQLGIGMTKTMRSQTRRLREQRRQAAREQAMKAPVKMLIPMVLFIFPTLFIVLLGPLVIQLLLHWTSP